jgi:hypothetical protein
MLGRLAVGLPPDQARDRIIASIYNFGSHVVYQKPPNRVDAGVTL